MSIPDPSEPRPQPAAVDAQPLPDMAGWRQPGVSAQRPSHDDVLAMVGSHEPKPQTAPTPVTPAPIVDPHRSRLVAMVRDPHWIFAYWDIDAETTRALQATLGPRLHQACWMLRLEGNCEPLELPVDCAQKSCYVAVLPGLTCRLSLVVVEPGGRCHQVARSQIVTTPQAGLSGQVDPHWPVVEAAYERVAEALGARESEGWTDIGTSHFGEFDREQLQMPRPRPESWFAEALAVPGSVMALRPPRPLQKWPISSGEFGSEKI